METRDEILRNLSHYTGTMNWFRVMGNVVATDGAKYVADAAEAHWLLAAVASHLVGREQFDSRLIVKDNAATLTLDDGNGNVFVTQDITYTNFPLDEIMFYGEWDGQHWVILLPGEH